MGNVQSVKSRFAELAITLPNPATPVGSYVVTKRVGSFVYTSGSSCFEKGKLKYRGRVGKDLTIEEGCDAARLTVLNLLSQVEAEIGSLDSITSIVKLLGFVNSSLDFFDQPKVLNAASDLLVEIFGDRGRHTRSAVGVSVLPMNAPVEIEMIVEVKE